MTGRPSSVPSVDPRASTAKCRVCTGQTSREAVRAYGPTLQAWLASTPLSSGRANLTALAMSHHPLEVVTAIDRYLDSCSTWKMGSSHYFRRCRSLCPLKGETVTDDRRPQAEGTHG